MTRLLLALCLAALPLASIGACGPGSRVSAAATKPTGPANGAGDYKDSPGGPATPPVVPTASGGEPAAGVQPDCPPKCGSDGAWYGCGLKKPRGGNCGGCAPKCKGKGTSTEGWFDCNGMMIAERKCE